MVGWNHAGVFSEKPCKHCKEVFKPKSGVHSFCSTKCRGSWKYSSGSVSTSSQYLHISGNWRRYYSRLCSPKNRKTLSVDDLLLLHERQNGLCAMTGQPMTCELIRGERVWTNASIDRIIPGGLYVLENIQLVCTAINLWRSNQPLGEFIEWCQMVAARHPMLESDQ